jgi:tRNA(fMet)-specific endonuclease VapC
MDKALLDTDILSEVLKGKNKAVLKRAQSYRSDHGRLVTSTISLLEIVKGLHKAAKTDRLSQFLQTLPSLEILTLDADSAVLAGKMYADLERRGLPIGRADPMIAAIAITSGRTLVTGNTAHFSRIQALGYSLDLDDWRTDH